MISCVGAPAAAMRRAMPTRPEWPEKPDPRPAPAPRMRREIDGADDPKTEVEHHKRTTWRKNLRSITQVSDSDGATSQVSGIVAPSEWGILALARWLAIEG